jgi:hypothetical protein
VWAKCHTFNPKARGINSYALKYLMGDGDIESAALENPAKITKQKLARTGCHVTGYRKAG